MRPTELAGRNVVIAGVGIDTLAFLEHGPMGEPECRPARVRVGVDDPSGVATEVGDRVSTLGLSVAGFADLEVPDVVIRSPGLRRRHPVVTAWEAAGASVTTPMDLWLGAHGSDRIVVGVTGTKGKSTTTTLIGAVLRATGTEVILAGNIGRPVWEEAPHPSPGVPAILEVSSYMAVDVHHPPTVGVLTSLDADHVSWHGSLAAYRADKLHLFTGGRDGRSARSTPVLVPESETTARAELESAGLEACVVGHEGVSAGVATILAERGFPHHVLDALAVAAEACRRVTGSAPSQGVLAEVARTHEALPSRHRTVAVIDGVRWVDDALASNPFAAAGALRAVGESPVVWILGGDSREVDPAPLVDAVADRVRRGAAPPVLIALPDTGADLCAAVIAGALDCPVERAESLTEAVSMARRFLAPGWVVLFAPAAPTPPRFGSYVDRAAEFAAAVDAPDGGG